MSVVIFSKVAACMYKATSGLQWISEHSCMSDWPQKQASEKRSFDFCQCCCGNLLVYWLSYQVVMINILCHCVHMWQVLSNPATYVGMSVWKLYFVYLKTYFAKFNVFILTNKRFVTVSANPSIHVSMLILAYLSKFEIL